MNLSRLLSLTGLLWCVGVGIWIWFTPIRYSGVSSDAWTYSDSSGTVASAARTIPIQTTRRFADVSLLGPVPLIVPGVLAALATLAGWNGQRRWPMIVPTVLLLAFCVIAGFSIGRAYVPGAAAIFFALLIRAFSPGPVSR